MRISRIALICLLPAALFAVDVDRLVEDARHAFESGRFKESAAKYLEASEAPGVSQDRVADLSVQAAWAYYIDGNAASARQSLKKAFVARPTLEVLAEFYSEDFANLARAVKAEATPPPRADLEELKRSARERLAAGLTQDVIYDLRNAGDSKDPDIHRILADAYEKLNKPEDAAAERRRAESLSAGAISEAPIGALAPPTPASAAAAPQGPTEVTSVIASAEAALAKGDFAAAADLAHNATLLDARSAAAHRIAGDAAFGKGDTATAEREYMAASVIDGNDVRSQIGLAKLADAAKQPNTAASHYRRALELDPKNLGAALGLGDALLKAGDKPGARLAFGRATEIDPKDGAARDRYGSILLDLGETGQAIDQEIEAVAADPKNADFHLHLASAYLGAKMMKEAEREFERTVEARPGDAVSWTILATLRADRHAWPEAEEAFQKALEASNGLESAVTGLASVLAQQEKWTEASAVLEKAASEHGDSAAILADLGVVSFRLRHFDRAATALRRASELAPSRPELAAAAARAEQARNLEAAAIPVGPVPAP